MLVSETCCALIPLLLLRLRVPPMLYLFCGFATQWSRRQESLAAGALPGDGPGLDEPKDGRGVTRLEPHSDTLSCAVVVLPVASPLLAACASLVRSTTKCSLHPRSSQKSSLKLQSCVSQLVQPFLTDRSTCRRHTYRVHDFLLDSCCTDLFLLVVRVYSRTLTPCTMMAQVTKHIVCGSPKNTHTSSRNVVHLATFDDTKHGHSFLSFPEPVFQRAEPLRRSTATAEWRFG